MTATTKTVMTEGKPHPADEFVRHAHVELPTPTNT